MPKCNFGYFIDIRQNDVEIVKNNSYPKILFINGLKEFSNRWMVILERKGWIPK
jgi:hypothetical protein